MCIMFRNFFIFSSRNIYKDPNISEAKRAQPVIKELIKRVQDVLEEWPDYPILIQACIH